MKKDTQSHGFVSLENRRLHMNESNNPSAIRSRKQITDALLKLMEKYPYEDISVKQIILETDLVRKTFYRNYSSKDDVLRSHIRSILLDYFEIVNNARGDVLTTIFEFAVENKKLLMLLDKNDMFYVVLQGMNEFIMSVKTKQNQELNPFSKLFEGLDSDYLISLNTGGIWNVISLWVRRGMTDDPDDVKRTIAQYLSRIGSQQPKLST
jgi:AcrR family transcriptional regulator